MGVLSVEPDLSGKLTDTNFVFFGTDQIHSAWETGRSQSKTGTTGGGQSGGRGGDQGCQGRRRRPGGHWYLSSFLQPQREWGRKRSTQQRACHGLFGQSQQRLRLRPRARPNCGSAGLAPAKDTFEATAPGRPPGNRGDLETGIENPSFSISFDDQCI